jgi:hypothetical protein
MADHHLIINLQLTGCRSGRPKRRPERVDLSVGERRQGLPLFDDVGGEHLAGLGADV